VFTAPHHLLGQLDFGSTARDCWSRDRLLQWSFSICIFRLHLKCIELKCSC